MPVLQIIYAPNPIFRKTAQAVTAVDQQVKQNIDNMLATLEFEKAVGIGANMVGLLQRLVVIDLKENGVSKPLCLINPKIVWRSESMQTFEEASLCFPGISAEITRPDSVHIQYLNREGIKQELEAKGFLATVVQHEMDYLDGKIFLDHLSKMKRDLLLAKMTKYIKAHPPHIHGQHCHH